MGGPGRWLYLYQIVGCGLRRFQYLGLILLLVLASLGQAEIGTREEKSPYCDGNETVLLAGLHGNPPDGVTGVYRYLICGYLVLKTPGEAPALQRR